LTRHSDVEKPKTANARTPTKTKAVAPEYQLERLVGTGTVSRRFAARPPR